jgi:hypothetical protein
MFCVSACYNLIYILKNITLIPAIIILVGALSFFNLPFWMTAVGGVVAGFLFPVSSGKAYAVGFTAGFLLWWGSAFFFNFANGSMLAGKMGELIGHLNSAYMLMITGTMGGVLAGFGTLTGVLGKGLVSRG